ncbi:hypothetical protein [Paenibacillus sophorae]|nr:hypothetical protein [Paenibacillus sophorae]
MNSIFAVLGFLAFVSIMILSIAGVRDERGLYIFNKFFKYMFFLLSASFSLVILISSWVDMGYELYRNMVTLLFSLSFVIGFFIWIGLWKRN